LRSAGIIAHIIDTRFNTHSAAVAYTCSIAEVAVIVVRHTKFREKTSVRFS